MPGGSSLNRDVINYFDSCFEIKLPVEFDHVDFGFVGKNSRIDTNYFLRPRQVHGTEIVEFDDDRQGLQQDISADGIASRIVNQSIAVVTADCLPVLFVNRAQTRVVAVHAGWRGLAAGIIERGAYSYLDDGDNGEDLIAIMGPCISALKYEVGEEVREAFATSGVMFNTHELAQCFNPGKKGHWYLDLAHAAALCLKRLGVPESNLYMNRDCTFSDADTWYSYRRSKAYEGNNVSWIQLI